jgi:iron complex transport system permease protein
MILVDLLANNLLAEANIPIGILTAFIGAPFFLYLLLSARRKEVV